MREIGSNLYYSPDDKVGGPTRKDLQPIQDETVPFGNSTVLVSKEFQLECPLVFSSSYESRKSILVIGEPHHVTEAQFNLFKGLEILFRDNPKLVGQTVLLAEGFPMNELVSVDELIAIDPHPSDDLIRQTLDSFLITGYMAHEWKHHEDNHIPIIGTEHPELYELSREFASWTVENPNAILAQVAVKETETSRRMYQLPVGAGWDFAIAARNQFIASNLMNFICTYDHVILFVGSGHMHTKQDDFAFSVLSQVASQDVASKKGIFGKYLKTVNPADLENHNIHDYLEWQKFGYTQFEPIGLPSKKEEMAYQQLFDAQRTGATDHQSGIDYDGYLNWLLKTKRLTGQKTTVQPDPKAAAEFVRRLKEQQRQEQELEKSGVVYEKPADDWTKYHWFETSPEEERSKIREKFGVDSIWELGPSPRGKAYELMRGAEPANNLKHVDDIRYDARTVTGMKTIELRDPTYQDISGLDRRVRECIDELEGYRGGVWKKRTFERGKDFDDVYLEIGIPAGKATRAQTEKLLMLHDYAESKGVTLVINEVP